MPVVTSSGDPLTGDPATGDSASGDPLPGDVGPGCPYPTDDALKLTSLLLGESGQPGEGLDVDGNASTCEPASDCSNGIDNNGGAGLALALNSTLTDAVTTGDVMSLLELRGADFSGNPFVLGAHDGELSGDNLGCAFQTEDCSYDVSPDGVDSTTCDLVHFLTNATISGDTLTAGSIADVFTLSLPLGNDEWIDLPLYMAQLEATVTVVDDRVTAATGILGAAFDRNDLFDELNALPAGTLPVNVSTIITVFNMLVDDDIDRDGDSSPDSVSIGFKFVAINGIIAGLIP